MSFSFGFSQADLSDDELIVDPNTEVPTKVFVNPLDHFSVSEANLPVTHTLASVVDTLVGVRVTFQGFKTVQGNVVYRRELFDVKHQLMAEDDNRNDEELEILMGNTNEDVRVNVYEGGLKSWECSYDAVDALSEHMALLGGVAAFRQRFPRICEFGCGTGLPLSYLLAQFLDAPTPTQLVLSDFNYSVLRLVTVPNMILNWAATVEGTQLMEWQQGDDGLTFPSDELVFTHEVLSQFQKAMEQAQLEIVLVSGSWGPQFNALVGPGTVDYIISSETIYAPSTLPVVGESIIKLLGPGGFALVAAKDIYFGVGGSVGEFAEYLASRRSQGEAFTFAVRKIESSLQRSIVEITKN